MSSLDKYSLIAVSQYHNVAIANTFFINVIDDAGAADKIQSIANEFDSNILVSIAGKQTNEVVYECLLIQKVSPQTEPARVVASTRVGSLPSEGLPSNQSLCVNHTGGDGRPRFRGRWFIAGIPETSVFEGRFTDATEVSWDSFLLATAQAYGPAGEIYQLVHFSKVAASFTDLKRSWLSPIPRKLRNRTRKLCSIS